MAILHESLVVLPELDEFWAGFGILAHRLSGSPKRQRSTPFKIFDDSAKWRFRILPLLGSTLKDLIEFI